MPEDGANKLSQLRSLLGEFSDPAVIPEERLTEIGYVRITNEGEQLVRLVPASQLISEALQSNVVREERERRMPPFDPFDMLVDISGGFRTDASPYVIRQLVPSALEKFHGQTEFFERQCGNISWLPDDHPIQQFLEFATASDYAMKGDDVMCIEHRDGDRVFFNFFDDVAKDIETEHSLSYAEDGDIAELASQYMIRNLSDSFIDEERTTTADAGKLWQFLERIKSRLSDREELDKAFIEAWSTPYLVGVASGITVGAERIADVAVHRDSQSDYEIAHESEFVLHRDMVANALRAKGFADVADSLGGSSDVAQMRSVLTGSLKQNNLLQQYKMREKGLMATRAGMTGEANIFEFSRQLQALRSEQKASMRWLRGAHAYLHLPDLFATSVTNGIGDIQEKLITQATGQMRIILNPEFDHAIDTNPGASSGDCTDGYPLPFGTKLQAHNIKVFREEDRSHLGNIYLLVTTAAGTHEPVWHLDAIQIPNFAIDWEQFPATLIAALSERAAQAGISYITINKEVHHISNYDYISKAFLAYLGVDASQVTYDQLHAPDGNQVDHTGTTPIQIKVPPKLRKYYQFQASDDMQLVLWRNERSNGL